MMKRLRVFCTVLVPLVIATTIGCFVSQVVAEDAKVQKSDGKLRIIAFGAHPDDSEFRMGGTAAKWAALGHYVKIVSVTNGDIGHWRMAGGPLARRRTAEVEEAARRRFSGSRSFNGKKKQSV